MLAGDQIESVNGTVTEIANQQAVRKLAEIAGCKSDSPRCVES
jgi:hypothetical protein